MGYFSVWAIFLLSCLPHSWPYCLPNAAWLVLSKLCSLFTADYAQKSTVLADVRWGFRKARAGAVWYLSGLLGQLQSLFHTSAQSVDQPLLLPLHALLCRNWTPILLSPVSFCRRVCVCDQTHRPGARPTCCQPGQKEHALFCELLTKSFLDCGFHFTIVSVFYLYWTTINYKVSLPLLIYILLHWPC